MTNYDCKTRPATHATPTLLLYTHTHGDMHMHMHLRMWREGHRTLTLCAPQGTPDSQLRARTSPN